MTQDHRDSTGHIFATVISDAFDHRANSAVSDAETLPGDAAHIGLALRGAIESHIANDDVFFRDEIGVPVRVDDHLGDRATLPEIVVGVAFDFQFEALDRERAKTVPAEPRN